MAHYIVSFHARQADERIELEWNGTFEGVKHLPVFGEVHNYRYNMPNRQADEFEMACERMDAVAMYQCVEPEPLSQARMSRIAKLAGVSVSTASNFVNADWSEVDHRDWLAQSSDVEIAQWMKACLR